MNDTERVPARGKNGVSRWWLLLIAFPVVLFSAFNNSGPEIEMLKIIFQILSLLLLCCIFIKLVIIDSKLSGP